jgi:uracil-DNA glycosylase family 4
MLKLTNNRVKREWVKHQKKWAGCELCPLHSTATTHVLARGRLPCQVLFIGEAPGDVEDIVGVPFKGPSGKLLDCIIEEATTLSRPFTYAITNILACAPWADPEARKVRPPTPDEAKACQPRLAEVISIANPKAVVLVGKTASKFAGGFFADSDFDSRSPIRKLELYHPAFLLRKGGASPNNHDYKRTYMNLAEFITEVFGACPKK